MQLLTFLTLLYAAVLVGALALALTAICGLLWWISITLRDVRTALEAVRDRTIGLDAQFRGLKSGVETAAESIGAARFRLESASERVVRLAERAGLAQPLS